MTTTPAHLRELTEQEKVGRELDDICYRAFCRDNQLDPNDQASAAAYEDAAPWQIEEPPEDHRV